MNYLDYIHKLPIFHSSCKSKWKSLCRVWLFMAPWTVAHHALLSMARILEWVVISFSRVTSTQGLNPVSCIAGRFFTVWTTRETQVVKTAPNIYHRTPRSEGLCSGNESNSMSSPPEVARIPPKWIRDTRGESCFSRIKSIGMQIAINITHLPPKTHAHDTQGIAVSPRLFSRFSTSLLSAPSAPAPAPSFPEIQYQRYGDVELHGGDCLISLLW